MDNENIGKIYCTNMDKDDPLIEKYMEEYKKEKDKAAEALESNDDFLVNFDITYADGSRENYTCGKESKIFGISNFNEELDSSFLYEKGGKWENCQEEWIESSKARVINNEVKEELSKEKYKEAEGRINVYSLLTSKSTTKLKGVMINLYKINGTTLKLVDSKMTNEDGTVEFINVEEGNYRIIEVIDRKFFNKPFYLNWNEVRISKENKKGTVCVINSIKKITFSTHK